MFAAVGLLAGTVSMMAGDITTTLVHTAGTRYGSAATVANTIDAEQEYYNNDGTSGWIGYAFAEFSFEIPEGDVVKSATLTWTATSSKNNKSRDNKIYYLNAGTSLDYDAIASTQDLYRFDSSRTYVGNTKSSKKEQHVTDVTAALKDIVNGGQKYVVFQWTGNAESGTLEGKASDEAPVLAITTASADEMTKYTVKFVDGEGNELKPAVTYDVLIGEKATASETDMAYFYTDDKAKKYIYVSGNTEIETVKESESNVITLVFREANKYGYRLDAVDPEGKSLKEGLLIGIDFEGETVNAAYPAMLNFSGRLYTAGKLSNDGKGYYLTLTLSEETTIKEITYTASETTDVVYFSEAEDIEGLTEATNANTAIRSSNGASAYAADSDVVFTKLPAGKYKLTTVICDASKNAGSVWNFTAGNDTVFTFTANKVNWIQGTSDEFTLTGETAISLCKGGNANQAVDLIYIQKTGDYVAPEVVIEKFSDLLDLEDGTEVTIKTTDAVISVWQYAGTGNFVCAQDSTGAVKLSDDMAGMMGGIGLYAGSKIVGTIYATYTAANGTPTLDIADKTQYSTIDMEAGTAEVEPVEMTVADVQKKSSLSRYVEVKNAKMWADEDDLSLFYISQGTDTIQVYDAFWAMPENFTAPDSIEYVKGVVVLHDGKPTIYPYGNDAVPVQIFEAGNIAALADATEYSLVKLTLTNAKVTVVAQSRWSTIAYLEDETGALEFGEVAEELGLEAGMTVNGTIYALYGGNYGGMSLMSDYDYTAKSEIETEAGTAVPTATTIAEVKKESNVSRFVSFKNARMVMDEENGSAIYMIQGTDTIKVYDSFNALPVDSNYITVVPDSLLSSEGIIGYSDGEYMFSPTKIEIAEVGPDTGIKAAAASMRKNSSAAVYSVSGVKVRKDGQSREGLAKGLYIINGKKVVVK